MSEKFSEPDMNSTVELEKDYLLNVPVDDLLINAKEQKLEIDTAKAIGRVRSSIDSLRESINEVRKRIRNGKIEPGMFDTLFVILNSSINNSSKEVQKFKLDLTVALGKEIKEKLS